MTEKPYRVSDPAEVKVSLSVDEILTDMRNGGWARHKTYIEAKLEENDRVHGQLLDMHGQMLRDITAIKESTCMVRGGCNVRWKGVALVGTALITVVTAVVIFLLKEILPKT